jgi:calcineurin-like phosphoesterase family protein
MITAEIKLPEKDAEMILKVISKLGGKVKLINPDERKLSPAAKKMKKDLEQAFKEVKLHQEGKIQLKTLSEVLDDL